MIKLYNFDELKPEEILNRDIRAEKNVEDVVDAIIADVRARGDDALKDYALKFDGATIENLQVTQAEIDEAFAGMDPYFLETRQGGRGVRDRHDHPRREGRQGEPGHSGRCRHRRSDQNFQDRRRTGRGGAGLRHPEHSGGG